MFSALRAVIVDEIHAVAGTKRGAHLALTLERLERLAPDAPQRIGLSATQRPLEEIARFLGGCDAPDRRSALYTIVDCGLVKKMETDDPLARRRSRPRRRNDLDRPSRRSSLDHIRDARTTLVFVNNRAQAEKIAARINTLAGEEIAQPYHGSLSRERRFMLEERLKAGELRALVTTSSLELGIDVGSVDLVLQLQSPKRVADALQRVGRAGHTLDRDEPRRLRPDLPRRRDRAARRSSARCARATSSRRASSTTRSTCSPRSSSPASPPNARVDRAPSCSTSCARPTRTTRSRAARSTRRSRCSPASIRATSPPSSTRASQWDRITDTLTPMRAARMVATISGGTIPDRGLYTVNLADRTRLGELDEEFVHESRVGDAFQLGSSTWRIRAIEHDRVIVVPAPGAPARMPFWHGEFMARSSHLTARVGELRRELDDARTLAELATIQSRYHADEPTTRSLVEYVQSQRAITRYVPDDKRLVLEQFRDEVGSRAHGAPRAVRRPRQRAVGNGARPARCARRLGVEVQVQTTDDGIMLRLPDLGGAPPVDVFRTLDADEAERLVLEEVGAVVAVRRALPHERGARAAAAARQSAPAHAALAAATQGGRSAPGGERVSRRSRFSSRRIATCCRTRSTCRRCATCSVASPSARSRSTSRGTELPSPFAASLQFGFVMDYMYGDDTPRAEQRAALLSLDRALLDELMGGEGADDATIAVLERAARAPARHGARPPGARRRRARGARRSRRRPHARRTRGARRDRRRNGGAAIRSPRCSRAAGWSPARIPARDGIDDASSSSTTSRATSPRSAPASSRASAPSPCSPSAPHAARCCRAWSRSPAPSRSTTCARATTSMRAGSSAARRSGSGSRCSCAASSAAIARPRAGARAACSSRRAAASSRRRASRSRRSRSPRSRASSSAGSISPRTRASPAHDGTVDASCSSSTALARAGDALGARLPPVAHRGLRSELACAARRLGRARVGRRAARRRSRRRAVARDGAHPILRARHRPTLAPRADRRVAARRRRAQRCATCSARRARRSSPTSPPLPGSSSSAHARCAARARRGGLVTNDTVEALRDVLRWRPRFPIKRPNEPDPTRWLPAGFTPSAVAADRAAPHQSAADREVEAPRPRGAADWGGRWSLVHTLGTLGPEHDEQTLAERVARQWLARYGIVSRDGGDASSPPSGGARSTTSSSGSSSAARCGAATSSPDWPARSSRFPKPSSCCARPLPTTSDEIVVMSASDPANVYALPARARRRGRSAGASARRRGAARHARRTDRHDGGRARRRLASPRASCRTTCARARSALAERLIARGRATRDAATSSSRRSTASAPPARATPPRSATPASRGWERGCAGTPAWRNEGAMAHSRAHYMFPLTHSPTHSAHAPLLPPRPLRRAARHRREHGQRADRRHLRRRPPGVDRVLGSEQSLAPAGAVRLVCITPTTANVNVANVASDRWQRRRARDASTPPGDRAPSTPRAAPGRAAPRGRARQSPPLPSHDGRVPGRALSRLGDLLDLGVGRVGRTSKGSAGAACTSVRASLS